MAGASPTEQEDAWRRASGCYASGHWGPRLERRDTRRRARWYRSHPVIHRYQPLLFDPVPSLLGYSLAEMLEEVRAAYFPELEGALEARFVENTALAYINGGFMGRDRHLVVFHPVLNHPRTPPEVMRFIAKHELTHIVRPPRMVCGEYRVHPPEFWEHEEAIGPERFAAWAWIHGNLSRCSRETSRGFQVHRGWRALRETGRGPYTPTLPFNHERWERLCPGDGGQMMFPPHWAGRPLPVKR